ncbi:MAG: FliA/WhiG family RNA polymerase sigma factor [Desulfobulbus propionicus]|nr:MAG: FliA/WhiG family RNA polymerase sigma factor [Desulfobulbus propionicus]
MYPPVPPLDNRSEMIRDNMQLVEIVVQRMVPQVPSFMTRDDMTSAAMVGLTDAANRFDSSKGIQFKTFAEHRMRGAILDEMRKMDWFSRTMRDKQNQLTQTMLRLERKLGRSPSEQEMADEMHIQLEDYHTMLTQVSHLGCVSLHETLDNSEEGRSFLDALEDVGGHTPIEVIEQEEVTYLLADILEELSEKERLVIALYYYEELTQKEIAEVISVSEGRVSQLHSQALLKLKVKLMNTDYWD